MRATAQRPPRKFRPLNFLAAVLYVGRTCPAWADGNICAFAIAQRAVKNGIFPDVDHVVMFCFSSELARHFAQLVLAICQFSQCSKPIYVRKRA